MLTVISPYSNRDKKRTTKENKDDRPENRVNTFGRVKVFSDNI